MEPKRYNEQRSNGKPQMCLYGFDWRLNISRLVNQCSNATRKIGFYSNVKLLFWIMKWDENEVNEHHQTFKIFKFGPFNALILLCIFLAFTYASYMLLCCSLQMPGWMSSAPLQIRRLLTPAKEQNQFHKVTWMRAKALKELNIDEV